MSGVPPPPPTLDRTPSSGRAPPQGVHCFERKFEGEDQRPPVRLVVFDCDETLTLSTFMPRERDFERKIGWSSWPEYISMMNFGTPFVDGTSDFDEPYAPDGRLCRLQNLFQTLVQAEDGSLRSLAVLTRNSRGAVACLNLLMMAKLADHFSVIWSMAANPGMPNGVYKDGEEWKTFNAPLDHVYDHKADVLASVVKSPDEWFPQLAVDGGVSHSHLRGLSDAGIVLVDDVRTNFQSPLTSGPKVLRYCKVARYDGRHPHMGHLPDMGGIGAKSTEDYVKLMDFVEAPWKFKAEPRAFCVEQRFVGCEHKPAVNLVVFGFDATLSLYTFLPADSKCAREIGFPISESQEGADFVKLNFESPWVPGSRVERLQKMLSSLLVPSEGSTRTLAILTANEQGAVVVLNLLLTAGLADSFSAIWAPLADEGLPRGVCRHGEDWRIFNPPVDGMEDRSSKGDLLGSIVERPHQWFPQAVDGEPQQREALQHLAPGNLHVKNIVLIDDEMTNFHCRSGGGHQVLRFCKVACYDDEYYDDFGLLMNMGGIGARNEQDYNTVLRFIEQPWRYRVEEDPDFDAELPVQIRDLLEHVQNEEDLQNAGLMERQCTLARSHTVPVGEHDASQEQSRPKTSNV